MTTSSTTDVSFWLAVFFLISILAVPILWALTLSHLVYISKKYLNDLKKSIKSSPELISTVTLYESMGLSRKIFIPGLIYKAVSEKRFISIGFISPDDVENFPKYLKALLRRNNLLHRASLIWTLSVFLILTINGSSDLSIPANSLPTSDSIYRTIFDLSTWSRQTWLFVIGLAFLALFASLAVTENPQAKRQEAYCNPVKSRISKSANKNRNKPIKKMITLENILIALSISWIILFITLKETIGSSAR